MRYTFAEILYRKGYSTRELDGVDSYEEKATPQWKRGWLDANQILLSEGNPPKDCLDRAEIHNCI